MANPIIKIKRSSVEGKQPGVADLPLGELALNTYDGRLYVSKSTDSGVTTSIVNVSGIQIQDEGTIVGYANTLNFVGTGVTVLSFSDGVGIVSITASSGGGGSQLTGIVTSITAGSGISVDQSTGNVTITATGVEKTVNTYTATESQTSFSATYSVGYVDVFLNGVKLSSSQFTATDGTSIVLLEGASADDVVEVVGLSNINISTSTSSAGSNFNELDASLFS
jgi:hypothetical protein